MSYEPELLGGFVPLQAKAQHAVSPTNAPYAEHNAEYKPCTIRAIPYYAWVNHAPDTMTVWVRER